MCTIYEFPKAITLPKELDERLRDSANEYVLILSEILEYFENENFSEEDLVKVMELMIVTYLEAIEEAVDEI